jgi:predicted TIM-barrel fold metal-dependent hydrolase
LLASMGRAGVDASVMCGFWWERAEHAAEHRAYLLEAAHEAGGRLLPFVPVARDEDAASVLAEAAAQGALGVGEVRIADLEAAIAVTRAASAHELAVLAHCSEEVGHAYPGKAGGLTPAALWRLIEAVPEARLVAAHWGRGFPFFAQMPEVRRALDAGRVAFDTAATPLLYEPGVFEAGADLVGHAHVLWGSDFPLREQAAERAHVEANVRDEELRVAILGGNAARLLEV